MGKMGKMGKNEKNGKKWEKLEKMGKIGKIIYKNLTYNIGKVLTKVSQLSQCDIFEKPANP